MKQLLFILSVFPILSQAQLASTSINKTGGIKWTSGLSWEEIRQKAKVENKYIFIDCFATWCGPCKKMDHEVYTNDTIGEFFNNKFISIKLQMDKTKNDNEFIQSWYKDAATLGKQYRVLAFPTFVFLNPQGIIVHKKMGYQTTKEMMALAQTATMPEKVYDDPFAQYDFLVSEYKIGIKHYDRMPYMIQIAYKLGENDFAKQLLNEHTEYAAGLKAKDRYTKENIELWATYTLSSEKKRFWFFYNDSKEIDRVMKKKGYAKSIVDRTIQAEIVSPFFKVQPTGYLLTSRWKRSDKGIDSISHIEADWKKLYNTISRKYNSIYAKRNVINAKMQWYKAHNNFSAFVTHYLRFLDIVNGEDQYLNGNAWNMFIKITDIKILNKIIPWMEKFIQNYKDWPEGLDTYANLLYKVGRKQEAILWEIKALNAAKAKGTSIKDIETFGKVVEQMKRNEPTYLDLGACWPSK